MQIKYVYVYGHGLFYACSQNAKIYYWLPDVCLSLFSSVGPHGTTRLLLSQFSLNLKFEYFSKIC